MCIRDGLRIIREQLIRAKAHALHHTGAEAFEYAIGIFDESPDLRHAFRRLGVNLHHFAIARQHVTALQIECSHAVSYKQLTLPTILPVFHAVVDVS